MNTCALGLKPFDGEEVRWDGILGRQRQAHETENPAGTFDAFIGKDLTFTISIILLDTILSAEFINMY
jgi:hypothetical protein